MTDGEPIQLHVTRVGEDDDVPRVLFLHGLFGQGKNFTQIAKSLSDDFTSWLVDLPNHGRSDWTDEAGYDTAADAVAAWMRKEAEDQTWHVVGHSMGGKTAMALALQHPDLVERLVVVDIAPNASDGASEFEHLLDSLAKLDLSSLSRRGEADELLRDDITTPGVRGFLLQNLRSGSDGFYWQANLDLLRDRLDVIAGFPEYEDQFEGPVLWIAGEESDYIGDGDADPMRALFPRTRSVTIKGAGHWVHSEQPDAFVSTVRAFLKADSARLSSVRS